MNHIFELSHSMLVRIPFFKILLLALLLGVGRVNGQTVYFGDYWYQMNTVDGENFTLENISIDDVNSSSVYFYEDPGTYYYGDNPVSGIANIYASSAQCSVGLYININYNRITHQYALVAALCSDVASAFSITSASLIPSNLCSDQKLKVNLNPITANWTYQWFKNGQIISGADSLEYIANNTNSQDEYVCHATCTLNNQEIISNSIVKSPCSTVNYMLIENVTVTGINTALGTAQVQFDINWGNSWKDSINWDAAWVFIKYKNTEGEWKHAKINAIGYDHGQGTSNIIQPTSDKMGAFVRMADYGQTNFSVDGMQLQWNFSLDGLSNVSNMEIKLFAIEMVYNPIGSFSFCDGQAYKPKGLDFNYSVINERMSPSINCQTQFWDYSDPNYLDTNTIRIKGNAGIDTNNDNIIDNPNYPTGYFPYYAFKFELTDQQYSDFLNCLNEAQKVNLEVLGGTSSLNLSNGKYYASSPNRAFSGTYGISKAMLMAYADWSGLRPISVLEFSKSLWGPSKPYLSSPGIAYSSNGNWNIPKDVGSGSRHYNGVNSFQYGGSGYFGMKDMMCSLQEPCVSISSEDFSILIHGNGEIDDSGNSDIQSWQSSNFVIHRIQVPEKYNYNENWTYHQPSSSHFSGYWSAGIRLSRSAE